MNHRQIIFIIAGVLLTFAALHASGWAQASPASVEQANEQFICSTFQREGIDTVTVGAIFLRYQQIGVSRHDAASSIVNAVSNYCPSLQRDLDEWIASQ